MDFVFLRNNFINVLTCSVFFSNLNRQLIYQDAKFITKISRQCQRGNHWFRNFQDAKSQKLVYGANTLFTFDVYQLAMFTPLFFSGGGGVQSVICVLTLYLLREHMGVVSIPVDVDGEGGTFQ